MDPSGKAMEGDLSVRDGDRCTASGDVWAPEMAHNGTINANFCRYYCRHMEQKLIHKNV